MDPGCAVPYIVEANGELIRYFGGVEVAGATTLELCRAECLSQRAASGDDVSQMKFTIKLYVHCVYTVLN